MTENSPLLLRRPSRPLEVRLRFLDARLDGRAALLPVGRADLSVLLEVLQGIEYAKRLVHAATKRQIVNRDGPNNPLLVEDEEAAEGDPLPEKALESIRRNRVALKGPVGTPIGKGFQSVNVRLRQALDLYANLRPVRNVPSVASRFSGVDLVIVRENTEDLYAGLEHTVVPGVVESLKIITETASTRIACAGRRSPGA